MPDLILLLLAALVVGATVTTWWARRGWLTRRRRHRVIVHTVDGTSIEGTLATIEPDGIVLVAPRLVDAEVALAGDLWVPRAKVLMVQHPPAEP